MIETLPWILSAIGVAGAFLNACQHRSCFIVWMLANIGWIFLFAHRGMVPEALLFVVYLVTAVLGFRNWRPASV